MKSNTTNHDCIDMVLDVLAEVSNEPADRSASIPVSLQRRLIEKINETYHCQLEGILPQATVDDYVVSLKKAIVVAKITGIVKKITGRIFAAADELDYDDVNELRKLRIITEITGKYRLASEHYVVLRLMKTINQQADYILSVVAPWDIVKL